MDSERIPVCEPNLGQEEVDNAADAVRSGWISGYKGKYLDEFEKGFAEYCGCKHGIATTSCFTAMILALESLKPTLWADEVITSTFTMIATVSAIIHARLEPIVMDVDPDTWCMDPKKLEQEIRPSTKAIMPVPVYGHPVDIKAIKAAIRSVVSGKIPIIEDAAEVHGAEYYGKRVGSLSDAACYSFYTNKTCTTGEGGMIVTNNDQLAKRARLLRGYATRPEDRFTHLELGSNWRMTNVQAAIGCAQLKKLDGFVERKREIAKRYTEQLKEVEGLQLPVEKEWAKNTYWVYGMLVKPEFGRTRDEVVKILDEKGVETRNFFVPMHRQPALRKMGLFKGVRCPVAERISEQGLYLPNGTTLKDEQVDRVCEAIRSARV